MLLHFVGGLGEEQNRLLTERQLLAIRTAKLCYPEADILLHTTEGTWSNAPSYVTKLWLDAHQYAQLGDGNQPGSKQANWARLDVLEQFGGLYLDTDVFCLKPWPAIGYASAMHDMCAIGNSSNGNVKPRFNNGIIYASAPNCEFISTWRDMLIAEHTRRYAYAEEYTFDWDSGIMPWDLSKMLENKVLIEQNYGQLHGFGTPKSATCWAKQTNLLPNWVLEAYCVHAMQTQTKPFNRSSAFYRLIVFVLDTYGLWADFGVQRLLTETR